MARLRKQKRPSIEGKRNTQTDNEQSRHRVAARPTNKAEDHPEVREKKESNMERSRWRDPMVWFSGAVAVFTLGLFCVAYQQFVWIKGSERPWVGPGPRAIEVGKATEQIVAVQWTFKNTGKSPALNVRVQFKLKPGAPIPDDRALVEGPLLEDCQRGVLPGSKGPIVLPGLEQNVGIAPTQEVIDANESIKNNRVGLYLVGCIDYVDQTGEEHRTDVCEYYTPALHIFSLCPTGNSGT